MIITRQHYFQQVSWWQFTEQSNINKEAATIVWELEGNTEANMGEKKYTTEPETMKVDHSKTLRNL